MVILVIDRQNRSGDSFDAYSAAASRIGIDIKTLKSRLTANGYYENDNWIICYGEHIKMKPRGDRGNKINSYRGM